jgi:hypothetical protein
MDDEVNMFSFSEQEFYQINWQEKNKEFELKGKMYDVASIEFKNGVYKIYCENDLIEDLLIGFLKSSQTKSKSKMPQFQLSEPESFYLINVNFKLNSRAQSFYCPGVPIVVVEENFPPPRIS